jgi:hypothetical protein
LLEAADLRLRLKQGSDTLVQSLVIPARLLQIRLPLGGGHLDRGEENLARFSGAGIHGIASTGLYEAVRHSPALIRKNVKKISEVMRRLCRR